VRWFSWYDLLRLRCIVTDWPGDTELLSVRQRCVAKHFLQLGLTFFNAGLKHFDFLLGFDNPLGQRCSPIAKINRVKVWIAWPFFVVLFGSGRVVPLNLAGLGPMRDPGAGEGRG